MRYALIAAAALLGACQAPSPPAADMPAGVQISRFSQKPVPRFESLKHDKVNGRIGPNEDYRVLWQYERKGLPVLILKESGNWRFVRDPAGDEVWIKDSQLSSNSGALSRETFMLKAGRAADSAEVARIGAGVLVGLGTCDDSLCQVTAGVHRGWAPKDQLWGASAAIANPTRG